MRQPWAWVCWLIATLVVISITRNPLYLVLILLCVLLVGISLRRAGSEALRPFPVWKLAVWIILLATIFNGLTSHFGETILFAIPGKLPLISGNITVEALAYGAINGLVLTDMLASFTVLNLALPVRDLISLIPRAFFPVAVVTSIAVTYLPTTVRQFRQIREAQAIRGHQMRTVRDWLPLWMPLLVGGLEHAMQLAEAMTARGFAGTRHVEQKKSDFPRLCMGVGLILLLAGWIAQLAGTGGWGLVIISSGAVLILGGLWFMGRQAPRTNYRREAWTIPDILVSVAAVLILFIFVFPIPSFNQVSLYYETYPKLALPLFSPALGGAILVLSVPGLMTLGSMREGPESPNER